MSRRSNSFRQDITTWQVRQSVTNVSSDTLIFIGFFHCSTSGAVSISTEGTHSNVKKVLRNFRRHL
jgi:hypothetical protein